MHSSLVTGDGLLAVSSNNRSVKEDVRKIHEESVAQLSKMTEEELLMEQRKLKQQLGQFHNYYDMKILFYPIIIFKLVNQSI